MTARATPTSDFTTSTASIDRAPQRTSFGAFRSSVTTSSSPSRSLDPYSVLPRKFLPSPRPPSSISLHLLQHERHLPPRRPVEPRERALIVRVHHAEASDR